MIPVALAMLGSGAGRPTVAFLGWFGPRGLASIVFAVILVEEADLAHESVLLNAIFLTVGLSVLLHGLTATPLAGATQRGSRPTRGTRRPRSRVRRRTNTARTAGRPGCVMSVGTARTADRDVVARAARAARFRTAAR